MLGQPSKWRRLHTARCTLNTTHCSCRGRIKTRQTASVWLWDFVFSRINRGRGRGAGGGGEGAEGGGGGGGGEVAYWMCTLAIEVQVQVQDNPQLCLPRLSCSENASISRLLIINAGISLVYYKFTYTHYFWRVTSAILHNHLFIRTLAASHSMHLVRVSLAIVRRCVSVHSV